jgi:hypothetical protein
MFCRYVLPTRESTAGAEQGPQNVISAGISVQGEVIAKICRTRWVHEASVDRFAPEKKTYLVVRP